MKTKQGFTLIELLVTLGIMAILTAVAAPAMRTWVQNNRITTAAYHLLSQLNYARSEAVRTNKAVNVERKGGNSQDFSQGWNIYTDGNNPLGNSAFDEKSGDLLLAMFEGYEDDGVTIKTSANGDPWIAFRADGMLAENGNVTIAVCDDRGVNHGRLISISSIGRVVVTKASAAQPLASCAP